MQRRINHKIFETNKVEKEKELEARRRKEARDVRLARNRDAEPNDIFSASRTSASTYDYTVSNNGLEFDLPSVGSSSDDLVGDTREENFSQSSITMPQVIQQKPSQSQRTRSREYPSYIVGESKKSKEKSLRTQQQPVTQVLNLGGYSEGTSRVSSVSSVSTAVSAGEAEVLGEDSKEILPLAVEVPRKMSEAEALRRYLSKPQDEVQDVERTGGSRRLPQPKRSSRLRRGPQGSGGSATRRDRPGGSSSRAVDDQRRPAAVQPQSISVTPNHRRTLALSHAIMTLALLSASASQLRFVIAYQGAQAYPALNYFLIATCIVIEILVGIGYVLLSRFEFRDGFIEKAHSYLIFGLFIVAVGNIILAAFALDDHICEEIILKIKKNERKDAQPPLSSFQQPQHPQPNFSSEQSYQDSPQI